MANFWRRNVSRAFWVPAISNKAAPTAAEVNAGTELTAKMADIAGFSYQNQAIPTPTWGTSFNSVIPGEDQVQPSSITFYEDKTSNPLRTTLAKGTVGHIVLFFAGTAGANPAATDKAEVWPSISAGPVRLYTFGNEPAKWRADLTPNDVPATDAVLA